MLTVETRGHKMSEQSHLMILATALKSINLAFEAQFNALTNDMATEAVLKALDCVEASHHTSPSSDTILYTSQGQHHGRPAFQHHQLSVLATMTAAATAARLSDFAIVSESAAGAALSSEPTPNKPFQNYLVFSLVTPVHLPTITDTGAMQHTTN
ncbi:uncharacterized protein ACA1_079700 [Acanthamoeba castellanii str. Neff]|uniref:Uncharacterized protein n=1 Tax=Acanthamoeba castellanii (strain ATCC 30010 / Neff) TaxID=1257118 RepID=L8H8F9_ACACF|nr:uncharacterized protein ACA1_079700 [Acanthamoeba castellanii str. Neff]ELR21517.1 hypothetical protein ACA1_079700 [Acanthamoeba castellanii str. Neff]